jgi:hypothetical protein
MARKRIIYQSQSVKINGTVAMGVQSCSYGLDVSREDVIQFGDLGAVDRVIMEAPTANMEVNMYVGGLSAAVLSGCVDLAIAGTAFTVQVGLDSTEGSDYTGANSAVTLTSGLMTSLSAEASVGSIPTLTMGFEGTDLSYASATIAAPATNINVATQSGVIVGIGGQAASFKNHFLHPQSCNVSFDLGSEALSELNLTDDRPTNPYLYAKVPSYPGTATMEIENFATDRGMSMTLSGLSQKGQGGTANDPNSGGKCNVNVVMGQTKFALVNATLDSVSFSNSVGDTAATCNANFGVSIGGPTSSSRIEVGAA